MVLVGNHEIELDNKTHATFEHYRHRFVMPDGGRPEHAAPAAHLGEYHKYGMEMRYQGGSSYYSLDAGPFHFVTLNVYDTAWYYNAAIPNLQREFLEADLAKYDTPAQRKITPLRFHTLKEQLWTLSISIRPELQTSWARATALRRSHGTLHRATNLDAPRRLILSVRQSLYQILHTRSHFNAPETTRSRSRCPRPSTTTVLR